MSDKNSQVLIPYLNQDQTKIVILMSDNVYRLGIGDLREILYRIQQLEQALDRLYQIFYDLPRVVVSHPIPVQNEKYFWKLINEGKQIAKQAREK